MNILFICSRNKWRSLTAETIYQNHAFHQVRSAGTAATARIKVTAKLIDWAELIFVMEKRHKQIMNEKFAENLIEKTLIILNIPDDHQYMDPILIEELENKVSPYL